MDRSGGQLGAIVLLVRHPNDACHYTLRAPKTGQIRTDSASNHGSGEIAVFQSWSSPAAFIGNGTPPSCRANSCGLGPKINAQVIPVIADDRLVSLDRIT